MACPVPYSVTKGKTDDTDAVISVEEDGIVLISIAK